MKIAELVATCSRASNVFHLAHWYIGGALFDVYHNVLEDLYTKLAEDVDTLAELALELGEDVSSSLDFTADPIGDLSTDNVIHGIASVLSDLLEAIQACLAEYSDSAVQNCLQGLYQHYSKELRYKNARRQIEVIASG